MKFNTNLLIWLFLFCVESDAIASRIGDDTEEELIGRKFQHVETIKPWNSSEKENMEESSQLKKN